MTNISRKKKMKKYFLNRFILGSALSFAPIISASCVQKQEVPFEDKLIESKYENSSIIGLKDKDLLKLNLNQIKYFIEQTNKLRLKNNFELKQVVKENDNLFLSINNKKYSLKSFLKSVNDNWDILSKNWEIVTNKNNSLIRKGNNSTDVNVFFENDNSDFKNLGYVNYVKRLFKSKYNNLANASKNLPDLQMILQVAISGSNRFSIWKNQLSSNLLRIENIFDENAILNQFKEYFEKQATFYLKAYKIVNKENKEFEKLIITSKEKEEYKGKNILKIKVDLLDKNNQSILNNDQKNKVFYLMDFQDSNPRYHAFQKYGNFEIDSSLETNEKSKSLFNEMFKEPTLSFGKNLFNFNDFDSLMHPSKPYLGFNLNSFMQFYNAYKEKVKINVPDENYEVKIKEIKFDKILNNSHSIGKAIVEIKNKKTNRVQEANWFTIDFTYAHKHIFDGFYIQNKLDCDPLKNDEFFSYYINKGIGANNELKLPEGINAEEFYNTNLIDIVNFIIYQNRDSFNIWNNKKMNKNSVLEIIQNKAEFEKKISTLISQYVLKFFINNKKPGYEELIKEVKVTIDPNNDYDALKYGVGKLPIRIDFINHKNEDMIKNISERKFLLGGFVGYDFSDIEAKLKTLTDADFERPLKDKTPPYLIKN